MLQSLKRVHRSTLQLAHATAALAAWRGLATSGGGGELPAESPLPEPSSSPEPQQPPPPAAAAAAAAAAESQHVISIDRSALFQAQPHSHDPAVLSEQHGHKEPETPLVSHLKALIRFRGGPLTLAEFMSEALTNTQHGYYSQRDVFGAGGDFVTAPEISQMMGELVGIWCVAAWQQLGSPASLRLVELGPGRGTLMADLLRGTAAFQQFTQALRVSLVEVSPHLRTMQWQALRCAGDPPAEPAPAAASDSGTSNSRSSSGEDMSGGGSDSSSNANPEAGSSNSDCNSSSSSSSSSRRDSEVSGVSGWSGVPVSWHRSLDEVAAEQGQPCLYIAHEFLDALPVHQFQKTERGWCERLVDCASPDSPLHLRMVLSPGPTSATRLLLPRRLRQLPQEQAMQAESLEVCPQAMALAESLASRISLHGGAALVIDYGQDGPYQSSLQAISRHQFVGLLESPGQADISNRVDYSALRASVEGSGAAADCLGPIPQSLFLLGMGIEARLEQLLAAATPEQAEALQAGYRRLVGGSEAGAALHEEGMGSSYQAFCIAQRGMQPWPFGAVPEQAYEEEEEEAGGVEEGAAEGGQQDLPAAGEAGEQQAQQLRREVGQQAEPTGGHQ